MARARRGALDVGATARVFAALGDETRLRLVTRLCEGGPTSIAKLTSGAEVTRQAVTKHLRVLEGSGLVQSTREGRESLWELAPGRLEEAGRYLEEISQHWDDAIARLKALVER